MVSLYPPVAKIEKSILYNLSKKANDTLNEKVDIIITTLSAAAFLFLGSIVKFVSYKGIAARYTTWQFVYYPSFMIGSICSIPFIINRIHKRYDDRQKIIIRSHSWSRNVGNYNLSKVGALVTGILGILALYSTLNPVIWHTLLTACLILSLSTYLLADIVEKQYKGIIADKNSKGINNFEISMTKTLGLYFGESKII